MHFPIGLSTIDVSAMSNNRENLCRLTKLTPSCFSTSNFANFVEAFCTSIPGLIDDSPSQQQITPSLACLIGKLFDAFEQIHPILLYERFARALLYNVQDARRVDFSAICEDPLILLRCDRRIFKCDVLNRAR